VPIETGVHSKRDFPLGFKVKTSQVKFTWTCLERRERSVGTRHTSVSNHNEVTRGLSQSISGLARISGPGAPTQEGVLGANLTATSGE
jgi:hypothetical protein